MLKKIIALIAAALIVIAAITITSGGAHATRGIPGFPYTDQCKNIKGVQPIYELMGRGPYRFKNESKKTCYRIHNTCKPSDPAYGTKICLWPGRR